MAEAAKEWGIVTGEGVVESGLGIEFVACEAVTGRAGCGLQTLGVLHLLTVGSVVGVAAKLAGRFVRGHCPW